MVFFLQQASLFAGLLLPSATLNPIPSPTHRLQVLVASTSKKPTDADMQKILAPTASKMGEIEKCKDNRSDFKDHLNTIAEGAGKCFPA
jgi:hypothetical protein